MSAPTAPSDRPRQALASCPAVREERCLIGVSGGRDSVALLHGLIESGCRRLIVCHLDHGLRGAAGKADARFVEKLAAGFGLPVETDRADVRALARTASQSLETAARAARLRFFAEVAARRRCRTLLLAHHADDQVETFLFNLFRGAGHAGLGAMRPDSMHTVGRRTLRILRPWLGVWRCEIDAYVKTRRLAFREDRSNTDLTHTRNRLRGEILPFLEKSFGREIKPALWRAADLLAAEEAWISSFLQEEIAALPARLPIAGLRAAPLARQRRVLQAWLRAQGVPGVGYREVETVRSLLDLPANGQAPAKVNLPAARHARRRGGVLFIESC